MLHSQNQPSWSNKWFHAKYLQDKVNEITNLGKPPSAERALVLHQKNTWEWKVIKLLLNEWSDIELKQILIKRIITNFPKNPFILVPAFESHCLHGHA